MNGRLAMRYRIFVSYDISSNKRRDKVAKTCESFGSRIQYSVFECPLDELRFQKLKAELGEVINGDQDQVLFFSLGPESGDASLRIESIGRPYDQRSRVTIL
jgi:CRISPR-associated protein Cas2